MTATKGDTMTAPPPYWADTQVTLYAADALDLLHQLPDTSVNCCVTSPPYFGLRDYGVDGQYGLEASPAEYVERLREVFTEVRRVLTDDGTLWLNIGDSYSGSWGNQGRKEGRGMQRPVNTGMIQPVHDGRYPATASNTGAIKPGAPPAKNLYGMPWRVAFALQDDGWIWRNTIPWHKPNAMPESVTDRLANRWEPILMLAKSARYWFDLDAILEPLTRPEATGHTFGGVNKGPHGGIGATERRRGGNAYTPRQGRNPGDVWTIPTQPFPGAHYAVMPPEVALRCVKAGCKPGGIVLDPFAGTGTTCEAARRLGRKAIGIDLNPASLDLAIKHRLGQSVLDFGEAS